MREAEKWEGLNTAFILSRCLGRHGLLADPLYMALVWSWEDPVQSEQMQNFVNTRHLAWPFSQKRVAANMMMALTCSRFLQPSSLNQQNNRGAWQCGDPLVEAGQGRRFHMWMIRLHRVGRLRQV